MRMSSMGSPPGGAAAMRPAYLRIMPCDGANSRAHLIAHKKASPMIGTHEGNPVIPDVKLPARMSNSGVEEEQEAEGFEPRLSYFDSALRRPPSVFVSTGARP